MNNLKIELDGISELVDTELILKLYETASSIPKPLGKQQDNAYMSGRLEVPKTYRNQVLYLAGNINGESNSEGRFKDLRIDVTIGYYISFEDANVKSILMNNNISSDGIGITETDASTANLGTMFKDNTTITSFNEFGYFTKANNSPANEMFKGCTNLESIDLSNMTSITTSLFSLTAITDINAPDLVSYTGYNLFSDCSQLKTISSLGHISAIPNSCFFGSYNLETVNLPDECISIELGGFYPRDNGNGSLTVVNGIGHILNFGYRAFYRLSNLHLYSQDLYNAMSIGANAFWYVKVHSIDCPNLTSLGASAFRENPVLTNVDCLGKISSIPSDCFRQDTALQTVKIPYECISIGTDAFNGCSSLTSITLYNKSLDDYAEGESPTFTNISRITSFGDSCFYNCKLLSLTASDLSSAVSINHSAFEGCSAISINTLDLSSVSTIGDNVFRNGPHIDNVIWSSSQTTLPTGVFGSAVLKSITNIDHVTKIYGRVLLGCLLNHVLYLKNVDTTCYYSGDDGNTFTADYINGSAYALYMPKTKDLYGFYHDNNTYSSGFFGGRGTTTIPVVYFKDLEEIYPSSFGSLTCTSLIINNTTPPTWYNSLKKTDEEVINNTPLAKDKAFPADCHITYIYVPDSALTTYTSDTDWSTLIAKGVTFKSMNELTHYLTEADWITAGKPTDGIIDAYMSY